MIISDLWIQEGSATYYAPVGVVAAGESSLLPMETLITATVQRSFLFDSSDSTHPIHNTGVNPSSAAVLFDTLTYHKGASLIRMMNAFLTQNIYKTAMINFLNKLYEYWLFHFHGNQSGFTLQVSVG
jgi:aminopeptidase N